MTNATIKIKNCKLLVNYTPPDKKFISGHIFWHEGGIDFKKKFKTWSQNAIAFIEVNASENTSFEIEAGITKGKYNAKSEWAGKEFEEYLITDIKLAI